MTGSRYDEVDETGGKSKANQQAPTQTQPPGNNWDGNDKSQDDEVDKNGDGKLRDNQKDHPHLPTKDDDDVGSTYAEVDQNDGKLKANHLAATQPSLQMQKTTKAAVMMKT